MQNLTNHKQCNNNKLKQKIQQNSTSNLSKCEKMKKNKIKPQMQKQNITK